MACKIKRHTERTPKKRHTERNAAELREVEVRGGFLKSLQKCAPHNATTPCAVLNTAHMVRLHAALLRCAHHDGGVLDD